MSAIPSNLSRVPNLLTSRVTQQGIVSSQTALLRVQNQLATSKRISITSDDPVGASLLTVLQARLMAAEQRERNLSHASSTLGSLDEALGTLYESGQEAKDVAASQIGIGSDAATRRSQGVVVSSLLDGVVAALNRKANGLHIFSGERTGALPVESFFGGYRYQGGGEGLRTDLGDGVDVPITIGADQAVGALSARVRGDVDLNPLLTANTRVGDLRGPGGEGAALSTLTVTIDDGSTQTNVNVDLSTLDRMGDIAGAIESAIRQTDPAALGGAFPSAIGFSTERLSIGSIGAGYTITFTDGGDGTARSLGLDSFSYTTAAPVSTNPGAALNPRVTGRTQLGDLNPATPLVYGDIVFRNGGRNGTVTTSATMTIDELAEAVSRLNLGVRVEVDGAGDTINVVNEVSGFRMSVEEAGSLAATRLGIRSLAGTTKPTAFNDGRGIRIADGNVNPISGLPDPNRNVDFRVTLTDGSTFDVDLVPADLADVNALIARINGEAAAAGYGAVFAASLPASGSGIQFSDTSGGAGSLTITSLNGQAAADLGLLDGTYTGGPTATLLSSDRARVRVDSLLSTLIELRESLNSNDESGIAFAGERLETDLETALQARAKVGAQASRVDDAVERLEDTVLLDQSIKSQIQDLDVIEAASLFSLLQTQLQAGLQAAAAIRPLSLLSFL